MNSIRDLIAQTGSSLSSVAKWVIAGYSEGDRRAQELFPRVQAQPSASQEPEAGLAGRVQAGLGSFSSGLRNVASRVAGAALGASNVALRGTQVAFLAVALMQASPIAIRMLLAGLLIKLMSSLQSAAQQSEHRGVICETLQTMQQVIANIQSLFAPAQS